MVAACPNVLLLRTLSKGYSLAGLRLADGLGAAELVAPMLSKTKDSYNVDAIAQAVGIAALEDANGLKKRPQHGGRAGAANSSDAMGIRIRSCLAKLPR
jgi:histidinol-phosphate/aromatic aminotransferase/cobyric acid decarboxylase-like protein